MDSRFAAGVVRPFRLRFWRFYTGLNSLGLADGGRINVLKNRFVETFRDPFVDRFALVRAESSDTRSSAGGYRRVAVRDCVGMPGFTLLVGGVFVVGLDSMASDFRVAACDVKRFTQIHRGGREAKPLTFARSDKCRVAARNQHQIFDPRSSGIEVRLNRLPPELDGLPPSPIYPIFT